MVKECRKGSLKNLETTVRSFIGPIPVKENIICLNCNGEFSYVNLNMVTHFRLSTRNDLFLDFSWWPGSFAATSVGKIDQICDSCIISLRSEATPSQSIKVEAGYV